MDIDEDSDQTSSPAGYISMEILLNHLERGPLMWMMPLHVNKKNPIMMMILKEAFGAYAVSTNISLLGHLVLWSKYHGEKVNPSTIFCLKILSAIYDCCIYSSALQTRFFMEANTMNLDQSDLGIGASI